jgi:hypothetical protein
MSSADFEAQLEQSVKAHRETIAEMAARAKERIDEEIAAVKPVDVPAPPVSDAFAAAKPGNGPAVRFDEWEDPI